MRVLSTFEEYGVVSILYHYFESAVDTLGGRRGGGFLLALEFLLAVCHPYSSAEYRFWELRTFVDLWNCGACFKFYESSE